MHHVPRVSISSSNVDAMSLKKNNLDLKSRLKVAQNRETLHEGDITPRTATALIVTFVTSASEVIPAIFFLSFSSRFSDDRVFSNRYPGTDHVNCQSNLPMHYVMQICKSYFRFKENNSLTCAVSGAMGSTSSAPRRRSSPDVNEYRLLLLPTSLNFNDFFF